MKSFTFMNGIQVNQKNLLEDFPPLYVSERKRYFYGQALKRFGDGDCTLDISRWECGKGDIPLCMDGGTGTKVSAVENYFRYDQDVSSGSKKVWFMNFADFDLFAYYGGPMFAQDEIQTLEHPLLGSVCEMLNKTGMPNLEPTVSEDTNYWPRPYLIQNVPWWIRVDTSADRSGINIYGRNFSNLPMEDVKRKVGVVDGNYFNNIIAVAAPLSWNESRYSSGEIEYILQALVASYGPAKELSGEKKCVIHTGNWGCGAFGGNRELMYLAQLYVAHVMGVDEIVFHAVSDDLFSNARAHLKDLAAMKSLYEATACIESLGYEWGQDDGN